MEYIHSELCVCPTTYIYVYLKSQTLNAIHRYRCHPHLHVHIHLQGQKIGGSTYCNTFQRYYRVNILLRRIAASGYKEKCRWVCFFNRIVCGVCTEAVLKGNSILRSNTQTANWLCIKDSVVGGWPTVQCNVNKWKHLAQGYTTGGIWQVQVHIWDVMSTWDYAMQHALCIYVQKLHHMNENAKGMDLHHYVKNVVV